MANKNALREATAAIKAGANAETTVTLCKNTISDLKKLPAEQKEKPAAVLGVLAQNEATAAVIVLPDENTLPKARFPWLRDLMDRLDLLH